MLGDRSDVGRVGELPPSDPLKELLSIPGVEGRQPCEHLVHQGAQGIPVHGLPVPSLVEDLWR